MINSGAIMCCSLLRSHDDLADRFDHVAATWRKLRRTAEFIVRHGPETEQDRWENQSGYSPGTIAAEIAGLVCAADLASRP